MEVEGCIYCAGCFLCDYKLPLPCTCWEECTCTEACGFNDCLQRPLSEGQVELVLEIERDRGCICAEGPRLTLNRHRHGAIQVMAAHFPGCPIHKRTQMVEAGQKRLN